MTSFILSRLRIIKFETILRQKCPYSEFFWSLFFPHSDWISPYSVLMQENTEQKNSEYGHFLRSTIFHFLKGLFTYSCNQKNTFVIIKSSSPQIFTYLFWLTLSRQNDRSSNHTETSSLICIASQWTGFYMMPIYTSIIKELKLLRNFFKDPRSRQILKRKKAHII